MKIRFITNHRGKETQEHFYQAGETAEIDAEMAQLLIKNHRAVEVQDERNVTETNGHSNDSGRRVRRRNG